MKKEQSTNTAIRITPSEKESLEVAAKKMGTTFTDLLKTGAAFYASFDPAFMKRIQTFSRNMGVQEYLVMQNLAISWMARREVETEVRGFENSILYEFRFTENGPVTGEELLANLKSEFRLRRETEVRKQDLKGKIKTNADVEAYRQYNLKMLKIGKEQGGDAAREWAKENPFMGSKEKK